MAGTQDPLTDLPPPSRFDFEQLSNFTFHDLSPSSPPPPPPSISWLPPHPRLPLRPRLLLIASSSSSFHLFHHLPRKLPLASLILPEAPTPPAGLASPPPNPHSLSEIVCNLYSLSAGDDEVPSVLVLCVPQPVPEERSYALAKSLLDAIVPEEFLVIAAVQMDHFRGKLSADEQAIFRLETDKQRLEKVDVDTIPYFPSGSIVAGLPAAILSRCQVHCLKARLLLSWPDSGSSAPLQIVSVLRRFPETMAIDFSTSLQVPFRKKSVSDLDIYL